MQNTAKIENQMIKGWKLRIALLTAILSPVVAATGAYYNLKADMAHAVESAKEQIDVKYARKESIEMIREDVRDVKQDVKDIKNLLIQRSR
jgi:hypothetical protein